MVIEPGGVPATGPPPPGPTPVPGNRWTDLEPPDIGTWEPQRSLTVVIPHYEAPSELAITLAALELQTYPKTLFEVVVVDDGSRSAPRPNSTGALPFRVVSQAREGFGLARARNNGAREADGEILVFLDCDMVPEPQWLAAHARWHHLVSDALSLGFRLHGDFSGFGPEDVVKALAGDGLRPLLDDRPIERPEWIEGHMRRMASLTSSHDDLYRVVTGGNLGMRYDTWKEVGGFDESFTQWGAEDIEFGYRAFTWGALLVPERAATCWHQGLGTLPDREEQRSLEEQRAYIAHLIAERTFRRMKPGRTFRVPYFAVQVDVDREPASMVLDVVEAVLGNSFHDIAVCVSVPRDHPDRRWLEHQFEGDPRVSVGVDLHTEAVHPHAAVRVDLPADVLLGASTFERVQRRIEHVDHGFEVTVPGAPELHRRLRVEKSRTLRRRRRLKAALGPESARARERVHLRHESSVDVEWHPEARAAHPLPAESVLHAPEAAGSVGSGGPAIRKLARRVALVRRPADVSALARWVRAGLSARLRLAARSSVSRLLRQARASAAGPASTRDARRAGQDGESRVVQGVGPADEHSWKAREPCVPEAGESCDEPDAGLLRRVGPLDVSIVDESDADRDITAQRPSRRVLRLMDGGRSSPDSPGAEPHGASTRRPRSWSPT